MIDNFLFPASSGNTDSFFFELHPNYFKVEHGFAKTIKPNTTYRLMIFKGIQKQDEMKNSIKGKLVGGKIIFEEVSMNFSLSYFSPTKNIEFVVKIYETKPNEEEAEIATYKIKSGDIIKEFKNTGKSHFKVEANLIENLVLVFDLFVEKSKPQLTKIVNTFKNQQKSDNKNNAANRKTPKKNDNSSEVLSQSDHSRSSASGPEGFLSGKKKLSRKRGHEGQLRSRHNSDAESDNQGSMRSSQRKFKVSPPTKKEEHFLHSPKKASPPRVDERSPAIGNAKSPKSQSSQKVLEAKSPASKDIPSRQALTSPTNKQKPQKNEQQISSNTKSVATPKNIPQIQTKAKDSTSSKKDESAVITPKRQESASKYSKVISPPKDVHDLEYRGNEKIFEIEKKNEKKQQSVKKNSPQPTNKTEEPLKKVITPVSQKKSATNLPLNSNLSKISGATPKREEKQPIDESILGNDIDFDSTVSPIRKNDNIIPAQKAKFELKKTTSETKIEGIINHNHEDAPFATRGQAASNKSESIKQAPLIATKMKPLTLEPQVHRREVYMQESRARKNSFDSTIEEDVKEQKAKQELQKVQSVGFYIIFLILSIALFYNAIVPSRKV